jgi:Na+-transporting NADH:ubiquinone oxidoreductase subunit NqrB
MNYTKITRLSLKLFIGFLVLTALIAMITVLTGKFGKIQMKILATTFTISAASICSMSCAAFIDKKKLLRLGLLGILLTISAAILLIAGLWSEFDSKIFAKIMLTLIVSAVAFAFAFLLVLPELNNRHKWVQLVSSVSIGILALQIVVAVWGDIKNDWYYRLLAFVAIIVGLDTLVIPILMKLQKGAELKNDKVVLERVDGDVYRDTAGRKYRLTEMDV